MFSKLTLPIVAAVTLGLAGCAQDNPGGQTERLQPINVEGHQVDTIFAAGWIKTCLGVPDDTIMSLLQVEHVPGDRHLRVLGYGAAIAEGDCDALADAVATVLGAGLVRNGMIRGGDTFNTSANAELVNEIDVDVD